MQVLLSSHPDADLPAYYPYPTTAAEEAGQVEALHLLIQHSTGQGRPWRSGNEQYQKASLLRAAIRGGHLSVIKSLLTQGITAGTAGDELVHSASTGKLTSSALRLIIDWGIDIAVWGPRALMRSLEYYQFNTAVVLLEAGIPTDRDTLLKAANPEHAGDLRAWLKSAQVSIMSNERFSSLLQAADQYGHTEFAQMLREVRAEAEAARTRRVKLYCSRQ
jgi:hypothetical protein